MKRFNRFFCLAAFFGVALQGCGFFAEPETFGELQINIRFAGDGAAPLSKASAPLSPQAVDRIVVVISEYVFSDVDDEGLQREVIHKEFSLGSDRRLRTTIQVPLQNADFNYFILGILAFQGTALLYSGQDFLAFDQEHTSITANVQLLPIAFSMFVSPTSSARLVTIGGVAQDTTITEFEIVADSVRVRVPLQQIPSQQNRTFTNPMMLFGDNTLVRAIAYRRGVAFVQDSRQVAYTGPKSDILVVLAWDQTLDLNLEILTPQPQIVSSTSPGDSVSGRLILPDGNGYGPEVYEWRRNSVLSSGRFVVRIARQRVDLGRPASGRVYILLGERQNLPNRRIVPFVFGAQDLQVTAGNIDIP